MSHRKPEKNFRYEVVIQQSNGVPIERKFEGTTKDLPRIATLCMSFIDQEMFHEGVFNFNKNLTVHLKQKNTGQLWTEAESLPIFDMKDDVELHLLHWEDEAELVPSLPRMEVTYKNAKHTILVKNMSLYQVVGELEKA